MSDLIVGIGLVLVIEGLLYAAFPNALRTMLQAMNETSDSYLRAGGLIAISLGVFIVWLVRG